MKTEKQDLIYDKFENEYITAEYADPKYVRNRLQTYSPIVSLSNKVRELFKRDPALKLKWNEQEHIVSFYSTDLNKVEAIRYVLPEVYNITSYEKLYIEVYYNIDKTNILLGRPSGYHYNINKFCKAFDGNPLWYYMHEWKHRLIANPHCWLGFSSEPVFYVDDNLQNLYGDSCYLPADLAKAVLDTDGAHICTYNSNRKLIRKNTVANSIYKDKIDWDERI